MMPQSQGARDQSDTPRRQAFDLTSNHQRPSRAAHHSCRRKYL